MKTNKITQLFIAFCMTLTTLSVNAQTSQVVYNNPEHTSGSLTLSPADCTSQWWYYDWEITVPANTPIKVTTQLNYEAYLEVYGYSSGTYQYVFSDEQPNTSTARMTTTNGSIYVFCEDWYGINPTSNVFTITFEVDSMSYSSSNDLHVPGDLSVVSNLDVFGSTYLQGNTIINSRLGIGTSAYNSKLHVYNYNQDNRAIYLSSNKSSTSPLYGLYSSASNGTGNVYGVYSTVSGLSGKKWAGYFNGGDVAIVGGKMGIGTTNPLQALDVEINADYQMRIGNSGGLGYNIGRNGTTGYLTFYGDQSSYNGYVFGGVDRTFMTIRNNGNIGIGTTQIPDSIRLAVAGKIIAEEIVVKLQSAGWPDYVFHQDYHLKPLQEVEQFVKTNKHLPGIPSAAQVEEKGLSMGEMQNKLLQKVEELTLYIIEQDKKIKLLEEKLK